MAFYRKPIGYNTRSLVNGARGYKPFNGFISGSMSYAPGAPSAKYTTLTFNGVPASASAIIIPDGPPNSPTPTTNYTFLWAGSPGAGVIPLVAGGGTAAQAKTAALNVLSAQLVNWTVTSIDAVTIRLTYKTPGINPAITFGGTTNISQSAVAPVFGATLPGKLGKGFSWLPDVFVGGGS